MHPFLRSAKTLLLVGLSWLPICAGAITLNALITKQSLPESSVLLIPAMIVELVICISIWYICRSFSLGKSNFSKTLLKHIASMILLLTVWLVFIKIYSISLDELFNTDIWHKNYTKALPLLYVIGFFLYFLACLIYYLVMAVEKVQRTEHQILEQKLLTARAELKSLKATIHPHFLFNTLTALSKLAVSDPKRAREVCLQLSDFYRYNLRYSQEDIITVKDELKHIENYLSIEKTRMGNRLNISLDIDNNALSVSLFSLTLLTLAENAVKHGIQQCIEGGTISISIQKKETFLQIEVSNPYDSLSQSQKGEGYGIMSLTQRMHAHYGEDANIVIKKDKNIFTVILKIPIHHQVSKQFH